MSTAEIDADEKLRKFFDIEDSQLQDLSDEEKTTIVHVMNYLYCANFTLEHGMVLDDIIELVGPNKFVLKQTKFRNSTGAMQRKDFKPHHSLYRFSKTKTLSHMVSLLKLIGLDTFFGSSNKNVSNKIRESELWFDLAQWKFLFNNQICDSEFMQVIQKSVLEDLERNNLLLPCSRAIDSSTPINSAAPSVSDEVSSPSCVDSHGPCSDSNDSVSAATCAAKESEESKTNISPTERIVERLRSSPHLQRFRENLVQSPNSEACVQNLGIIFDAGLETANNTMEQKKCTTKRKNYQE